MVEPRALPTPPGFRHSVVIETPARTEHVEWSSDGDRLAAYGDDLSVLRGCRELAKTPGVDAGWEPLLTGRVVAAAWSQTRPELLAVATEGEGRIWDTDTGVVVEEFATSEFVDAPGFVDALGYPDSLRIAAGGGYVYRPGETALDAVALPIGSKGDVLADLAARRVGSSRAWKMDAWGGEGPVVVTRDLEPQYQLRHHEAAITSLAWAHHEPVLAVVDNDGFVSVWRETDLVFSAEVDPSWRVTWSFDDRLLGVASYAGALMLWRTDTWEPREVDTGDDYSMGAGSPTAADFLRGALDAAFNPVVPLLAAVRTESDLVAVYAYDPDALAEGSAPSESEEPEDAATRVAVAGSVVAGYRSDMVTAAIDESADDLDVARDVRAVCSVIAAADVRPPLAIGLFGDWGTGKTFFMKLMQSRLRYITEQASAADETTYCTDIVQVEFNAWHFLDANLWASLVSHIFESLATHFRRHEETSEAEPWDQVLETTRTAGPELQAARRALATAEERRSEAEVAADAARSRLDELDAGIEARKAALRVEDFARTALSDVAPQIDVAVERLGFDTPPGSVDELRQAAFDARAVGRRLGNLWRSIGGPGASAGRRLLIVMLLVAVVVVPAAVAGLLASVAGLQQTATSLVALSAGWLGAVGDHLGWIRPTMDAVDHSIGELEAAADRVEQQATAGLAAARRALEAEHDRASAELARANDDAAAAGRQVADAEARVEQVRSGAFVGRLLRERGRAYREHLGIIDAIRRDFEGLSRVLLERAEQVGGEGPRADRIVLYIDDLDRCPAARVTELLQAVHLLLAFDLFVVVVGVDSRWLLHALESQYSAFGGPPGRADGLGDAERSEWRTTPQHYLEKIFQIPFTLRPMTTTGFSRLVDRILDPAHAGSPRPLRPAGTGSHTVAGAPEATGSRGAPDMPDAPETGSPQAGSPAGERGRAGGTPAAIDAGGAAVPTIGLAGGATFDPKPAHLVVASGEEELMKRLAGLVRSPRAAKRFVNAYRLLKATVWTDLPAFEGDPPGTGECQVAILLLALQTGYPAQAFDVFRLLDREGGAGSDATWASFVATLRPKRRGRSLPRMYANAADDSMSEAESAVWHHVSDTLMVKELAGRPVAQFARWTPAVGRFSFRR